MIQNIQNTAKEQKTAPIDALVAEPIKKCHTAGLRNGIGSDKSYSRDER